MLVQVIAVCKKLVKTQINTKSAQLMSETCEGYISRTAWSIILISFAIYLSTSTSGPGTLSSHYFFIFTISTNSVLKLIFIHCAINFSITSISIFSKLFQLIFYDLEVGPCLCVLTCKWSSVQVWVKTFNHVWYAAQI